jgi:saccharopine dehydrogenase (NAD+, L-lysine-forming)
MKPKTILIIGGYGNTGRLIADLLLRESNAIVVIAGRDIEKAKALAYSLNLKHNEKRASAMRVDAADYKSLKTAFAELDLVVVASSTIQYVENVAKAALEAGIDYLDTQLSTHQKLETLHSLQEEIQNADCCFITDGGFHPGVPAALVRYAATQLDKVEKADVGSVIQLDWKEMEFSEATAQEMVQELRNFRPLAFKNGQWTKLGYTEKRKFDFGGEFGERTCIPMYLEEMYSLPENFPSLSETGFYVGGFNWFTDYIVIPFTIATMSILPRAAEKLLAKLLEWSLRTFSEPPFAALLFMEAEGWKDGKRVSVNVKLSHQDGYVLTAAPVVACLLQYFDNEINQPGLFFQANVVEPSRFIKDIERLGIHFTVTESEVKGLIR